MANHKKIVQVETLPYQNMFHISAVRRDLIEEREETIVKKRDVTKNLKRITTELTKNDEELKEAVIKIEKHNGGN